MAENYVLLQRIELNASAASITFSNIPQSGYTDLKIVVSARTDLAGAQDNGLITFNGSSANFSYIRLYGDGSGGVGANTASANNINIIYPGSTATANTFNNSELYIPNYTSSSNKSWTVDSVQENNTTEAYAFLIAGLWSNTAAITSVGLAPRTAANFVSGSTFSLYGLAALGTTPTIAPKAVGGSIYTDNTYWYHVFRATDVFTPQITLSCDAIVIAGGGGAKTNSSSGGGAGGLLALTSQLISTTQIITVGAGGAGSSDNQQENNKGTNSQIGSLTAAVGGGGGIGRNYSAGTYINGGSGAGASSGGGQQNVFGTGTSGQGNNGGTATNSAGEYGSGGGGGAGAVGGNGTGSAGGAGGAGSNTYSSWASATSSGVSGYYAGGGAGGGQSTSGNASGGAGGGGSSNSNGGNGVTNTGSGGGAGISNGGSGGSGIVIIRYAVLGRYKCHSLQRLTRTILLLAYSLYQMTKNIVEKNIFVMN